MKNLFLSVLALLLFSINASAQQVKKATKTVKTTTVHHNDEGKIASQGSTQSTSKVKKDGTLDMRYKVNKEKKVVLKKDGTPDRRYKSK